MMLRYNFIYELRILLRSRWIQILSLLLLLLFSFSVMNGREKVENRQRDISIAKKEVKETDRTMLQLLDSVEQGYEVSASSWTIPTNPMTVANYHPRVAAMEPKTLAFISTGQADLFTHYVKPTASGDDFALNFTEMTSPVQLLFGSFDLAFVIVYLLPLLIIAFTYNVLSSEKEQGSLPLLASQPISIYKWVFQKLLLRFFWLSILVIFALATIMLIVGVYPTAWGGVLTLLGLILCYMLFWFALSFLVNLYARSSANNAVSLLGLWVVFVLLVPSVLNQLGSTLYPMPSRTLMINEMRVQKAEATKRQDEILDNFLRDHPEFALNDTTQSRTFWHRYMASQKLIKEELEPIVGRYEDQLLKQQQWSGNLQWLSPAIIVQESLNSLAGTSTDDYEGYRRQVISFAESWRSHFMPFLFNNDTFHKADYKELPQFEYRGREHNHVMKSILILFIMAVGLLVIGFTRQTVTKNRGIISA